MIMMGGIEELIAEYKAEGNYQFNGSIGNHQGEMSFYSSGRVIGTVNDNNQDGITPPTEPKLVLGYYSPKEKRLSFLKISRYWELLQGVIWTMKNDSPENEDEMKLHGAWLFESWTTPALQEAMVIFEEKGMGAAKEASKRASIEKIKEGYFSEDQMRTLYQRANDMGQTGSLSLRKL